MTVLEFVSARKRETEAVFPGLGAQGVDGGEGPLQETLSIDQQTVFCQKGMTYLRPLMFRCTLQFEPGAGHNGVFR